MPRTMIWLSYDLGVRGDYAGLYTWMDARNAKECGDSIAVLNFEYKTDLGAELLSDLKDAIELTNRTRIYVICDDPETGKISGRFLYGGRRASPWTGYAPNADTAVDEAS